MKMNNSQKIKTITCVVCASFFTHAAIAAEASGGKAADDAMLQYYKVSEKYACSPEELASFLEKRRKSLTIAPNIMTADQFIKVEAAKKKKKGEDNCLTLFDNLDVLKKIQKLISKLQNLKMPDFSTNGVGSAASTLAKAMYEAAKESICNALTKKAAEKLINQIMSRKLGMDMDDIKEFDAKKFAKGLAKDHAKAYLKSKDIDSDWLDPDEHKDLMKGMMDDQKDKLAKEAFKN